MGSTSSASRDCLCSTSTGLTAKDTVVGSERASSNNLRPRVPGAFGRVRAAHTHTRGRVGDPPPPPPGPRGTPPLLRTAGATRPCPPLLRRAPHLLWLRMSRLPTLTSSAYRVGSLSKWLCMDVISPSLSSMSAGRRAARGWVRARLPSTQGAARHLPLRACQGPRPGRERCTQAGGRAPRGACIKAHAGARDDCAARPRPPRRRSRARHAPKRPPQLPAPRGRPPWRPPGGRAPTEAC
jgi:hypothetical protein